MNNKKMKIEKPLVRFKFKTYKPEEIIASGGAKAFSGITRTIYDTQKAILSLSEIALTDEEVTIALHDLKASK
jgi:hypothetical protein